MKLRKRIFSYFLLAIYLMVVMHHSVHDTHDAEFNSNSVHHQHEEFKDIHHEHHFHVGIFHLLGHLFDSLSHSTNHTNEHLIVVQKTSNKKVVDHNKTVSLYASVNDRVICNVDAESLPDPPPFNLFLLHRLKQPNTPLRAPPALV